MVSLVTAGGLSLAAIAAIYKSWRSKAPAFLYTGLVLLVVSAVAWSISQGWEFGLVYALCLPGLLVWPFIAKHQLHLPAPKASPQPRHIDITAKQIAINLAHAAVVIVGLMIASLLISLAISVRMPMADTGQLAISIVMMPLIWGMLTYHYLATVAKRKALVVYFALSVISALMLMYLPGLK